jgi:molybdopterin synthase sulfur carrier subunit
MQVRIPSPLRSYTGGNQQVDVEGHSLQELLGNLDAKFPGIRFRMIDEQNAIRRHIKFYVNNEEVGMLDVPLQKNDVVHIIAALSGG